MKHPNKHVLVIGGGVAGLTAALELSAFNYPVTLVEQSDILGGHAARLCCKATERCVKCGACIVQEKINGVSREANIQIVLKNRVKSVKKTDRFSIVFEAPISLDPKNSPNRFETDQLETDAIIAATGFQPFDPTCKPYGYANFKDVITNLELEEILSRDGTARKPSDGEKPARMAFIQCVGSRDAKANRLWCSQTCCGAALRMAMRIKWKQPDTEIVVFYIDVQTFGKDFQEFFPAVQKDIRIIRAIPGDILKTEDNRLGVTYYDGRLKEENFEMVVLSVGMQPQEDNYDLYCQLGLSTSKTSFCREFETAQPPLAAGVFRAGTVVSPMGIADSIASASKSARDVINYFYRSGFNAFES